MENFFELLHERYKCNFGTLVCCVKYLDTKRGERGLFALQDIKAGEVVFRDRPLVIGPRSTKVFRNTCVICYRYANSLCPKKCNLPICSEICCKSKNHLRECAFFRLLEIKQDVCDQIVDDNLRCLTLIRSLFLNQSQKIVLKCLKYDKTLRSIAELQTLKRNYGLELDPKDEKLILMTSSVFNTNGFEVLVENKFEKTSLRGIYPLASMMNNDCIPNCANYFDSNQNMIVKATRDIAVGEEILYCYTKLLWSTFLRQSYLLKTKHFVCVCNRCKDPTELKTDLGALICFKCKEVIIPALVKFRPKWECLFCKEIITIEKARIILNMLGNRIQSLDNNVENILKFIKDDASKFVPSYNSFIIQVKNSLVWILGHHSQYLWPNISMELLKEKELICRELLQVLDALHAGQCKMRGLLLYELFCCLRETSKRLELDVANNVLEDSFKYATKEMKNMFHEARQILMHDVHAPTELKDYNLQEKQIGGN